MAARSEIVHCYVQLASTTSLMAAQARAKAWDRLPALEEQCATVVERLKQIGATEPLDPAQLDQAQRLMERIRANQDEVRRLVKPQLEGLVATMARLQRQGELDKAYGLAR